MFGLSFPEMYIFITYISETVCKNLFMDSFNINSALTVFGLIYSFYTIFNFGNEK